MIRRLLAGALVAGLGAGAGFARAALDRIAAREAAAPDSLLYLPNGERLKLLSLGHASLVADVLYLWAIQYYSNYERVDRKRYVEHVFRDVITELDPHYTDAYWLGALILTLEIHDFEAGLALLDKGIAANPERWILPYLAAWECYHAHHYDRAQRYFEQAAAIPGAPTVVRRMRAGLIARAGDAGQALEDWRSILVDPASDALSVRVAQRRVRELQVTVDVGALQGLVERFRQDNGRLPRGLEELVRAHYTSHLPTDPDGRAYTYDPRAGTVSSHAGRVLANP